jgi:hypothetical protein
MPLDPVGRMYVLFSFSQEQKEKEPGTMLMVRLGKDPFHL